MAQEEFGSYQILKIYLLGLLGLRRLLGLLEADDATAAGKHHFCPKVSTVGRKFRETEEQIFFDRILFSFDSNNEAKKSFSSVLRK